jgi:glycine cleavage system transcriptional repressor
MSRPFALSVVGRDRPGIVAALAEVLLRHGVNVEDSRMTILGGHLAMTLVLAVPDEADANAIESELRAVRERLRLESVSLGEVEQIGPGATTEPSHIVSVYGADHPGIVHAAASALAERGWNITDLETRLAGEGDDAIYALVMEVALTEDASLQDLERALEPVAAAERVEVTCRPLERDSL